VDNTGSENVTTDSTNPSTFKSGDDGDLMGESVTKSGKTWTWDASIHSDNMPDGPVSLVILAFDEAGNVNGVTYNVEISNNAPRLAKVFLATDLNDNNKFECRPTKDGGYIISARMEIERVNEQLGINLPESDDYKTVGGMILAKYQSFPKLNQVITLDGWRCKILKNTETKIELVKIMPL